MRSEGFSFIVWGSGFGLAFTSFGGWGLVVVGAAGRKFLPLGKAFGRESSSMDGDASDSCETPCARDGRRSQV